LAGVLLVGLGNPLMADDGAGVAVARRLTGAALPEGCRVEVGDTDSLRILSLWRGEAEIWLVDALLRRSPPGTVHRLGHDEILAVPQPHVAAHFLSLPESVRWMSLAEPSMAAVRYRLWGIEPERIEMAEGLSPAVERAVAETASEILAEIEALGRQVDE
jgi:hydrogenase maturation protease